MKLINHVNLIENKKAVLWLNIASIPVMGLFFGMFLLLARMKPTPSIDTSVIDLIIQVLCLVIVIVIHELIHGLFFKLFHPAGKVKFGFKNGMAYATSPDSFYSKGQFSVIALAPFVLLTGTLLGLYFAGSLSAPAFIFISTLHAAGCVGDFYLIYLILKAPKNALVQDTEVGIDFYLKETTD